MFKRKSFPYDSNEIQGGKLEIFNNLKKNVLKKYRHKNGVQKATEADYNKTLQVKDRINNEKTFHNSKRKKTLGKWGWLLKGVALTLVGLIPIWFQAREKRKTDKAKAERSVETDEKKTDNRIKLENKRTDNKIRIEKERTDGKLRILDRQQERDENKARLKREEREAKSGFITSTADPEFPIKKAKSLDEELACAEEDPMKLQLGWELLHKNLDCSWLSETQGGKTTFIFYLCYLLASGIINNELFPNWHCSSRVAVLYFALEQTTAEIKQHYPLENTEASKYFRLVTGAQNINDVLQYVNSFLKEFPKGDALIVIDNITVLKDDNGAYAIKHLNKALASYRQARMNGTLTTFRVYHADPNKVKEGKPLKLSMIADNRNAGIRANELIIINKFSNDSTMRYMIPRKQKFGDKTPQDCYLFDYFKEDDEYFFLGEYKLTEIIQMIEDEKNGGQPKIKKQPGRRRVCGLKDDDMLLFYEWRQSGIYTAQEIFEVTKLNTPQFNRAIKRIQERQKNQKNQTQSSSTP